MSTSPDDHNAVSPPLMTTFVVPTYMARPVAEFLTQHGLTLGKHPAVPDEHTWLAVPTEEMVKALSDVSGRYRVTYEEHDDLFGRAPRVVDTQAVVEPSDAPWMPVSQHPGLRPLANPLALPTYHTTVDGHPRCTRCEHEHGAHTGYAYGPPLSNFAVADVIVVICDSKGCPCMTRIATPTPV